MKSNTGAGGLLGYINDIAKYGSDWIVSITERGSCVSIIIYRVSFYCELRVVTEDQINSEYRFGDHS